MDGKLPNASWGRRDLLPQAGPALLHLCAAMPNLLICRCAAWRIRNWHELPATLAIMEKVWQPVLPFGGQMTVKWGCAIDGGFELHRRL